VRAAAPSSRLYSDGCYFFGRNTCSLPGFHGWVRSKTDKRTVSELCVQHCQSRIKLIVLHASVVYLHTGRTRSDSFNLELFFSCCFWSVQGAKWRSRRIIKVDTNLAEGILFIGSGTIYTRHICWWLEWSFVTFWPGPTIYSVQLVLAGGGWTRQKQLCVSTCFPPIFQDFIFAPNCQQELSSLAWKGFTLTAGLIPAGSTQRDQEHIKRRKQKTSLTIHSWFTRTKNSSFLSTFKKDFQTRGGKETVLLVPVRLHLLFLAHGLHG
jgi:hypothetical protein